MSTSFSRITSGSTRSNFSWRIWFMNSQRRWASPLVLAASAARLAPSRATPAIRLMVFIIVCPFSVVLCVSLRADGARHGAPGNRVVAAAVLREQVSGQRGVHAVLRQCTVHRYHEVHAAIARQVGFQRRIGGLEAGLGHAREPGPGDGDVAAVTEAGVGVGGGQLSGSNIRWQGLDELHARLRTPAAGVPLGEIRVITGKAP